MSAPAAKRGDQVVGVDTHVVMIPSPNGAVPTPMPMPFTGTLDGALSKTVYIDGAEAAVEGSTATNAPPHVPAGGPFQAPPSNQATIETGSQTVFFDDKAAARMGDVARTCNDPADAPVGVVIATGTIFIAD